MGHEGIVVILERGKANAVVKRAVAAGARGATIFYGRGSGEHTLSFFRTLQIEPAKEIILIIVTSEQRQPVFDAVAEAASVHETGKGIAFTFPISAILGLGPDGPIPPEEAVP